jgi:hypothetical protein
MTDAKYHIQESGSLVGRLFTPASREELSEAIELAFDYRGDVTLELSSGEELTGYLFNRTAGSDAATIELFPATGGEVRTVAYVDIRSIMFSGEDTANGKSWEAWVTKKEPERRAEAAQLVADAKARGHL